MSSAGGAGFASGAVITPESLTAAGTPFPEAVGDEGCDASFAVSSALSSAAAASLEGAASGGGHATAASTFAGGESPADPASTLASFVVAGVAGLAGLSGFGSSVDIVGADAERLVQKSPVGSGKWRATRLTPGRGRPQVDSNPASSVNIDQNGARDRRHHPQQIAVHLARSPGKDGAQRVPRRHLRPELRRDVQAQGRPVDPGPR